LNFALTGLIFLLPESFWTCSGVTHDREQLTPVTMFIVQLSIHMIGYFFEAAEKRYS